MLIDKNNLQKTFWRFVIPTTGALLVTSFYQLVDGYFIGNYIGQEGLTAMNMSWPIIGLIVGISLMVGIGVGSLCSMEQGKGNLDKAASYLVQLFWLTIILSLPAFAIIHFFSEPILNLQAATYETKIIAGEFLYFAKFITPIIILSLAAPLITRNIGAPNLAIISITVGAVLNVILDYVFVVAMELSLLGIAIAIAISQGVTITICIIYVFSKKSLVPITLKNIGFNLKLSLKASEIGLSSMITYIYVSVIVIVYNTLLMVYGGSEYVAAYAIIGYMITLVYLILEGIANGMQPIISYFYGSRMLVHMNKTVKFGLRISLTVGLFFSFVIIVFPEFIAHLFTNDGKVLAIATHALRINLCLIALDAFIIPVALFFQSIGSSKKAISLAVSNLAIKIPFLIIFPKRWGVEGIWLTTPFSDFMIFLLVLMLFIAEQRKIKRYINKST